MELLNNVYQSDSNGIYGGCAGGCARGGISLIIRLESLDRRYNQVRTRIAMEAGCASQEEELEWLVELDRRTIK